MANTSASADYKPDRPQDKTAASGGKPHVTGARLRSPDGTTIEEFVQLLARAVRQFRTYPPSSPLCTDAIAACHKVFAALEGRPRLEFQIVPHELIINDICVGAGTIVEHELARRLHRARVAALNFDRAASPRDLARLCGNVARCEELAKTKTTLAELMAEHGVETIVPRMAHRPEVLHLGSPSPPLCALVEHERVHRQSALGVDGAVSYLYPPDKGWVRLDPAAPFDTISLVDLAVLVEDPSEFATMLLRLTDDDPVGREAEEAALEQKFGDVATLFASLDPRLAHVMFVKLARAVLELGPNHRKDLLRRTILPGLLDGRAAGAVLREFPDVDLAEALCLLLDLETAAPEVLSTALDRLDLPTDRRGVVVPMLEARLRADEREKTSFTRGREDVDRYARRLLRVDAVAGKSFADFSAFDLSIDRPTEAAIGQICSEVSLTDVPTSRLMLLWHLVKLEPNPSLVEAFLRPAVALLGDLERSARWRDLAEWAGRYRELAEMLEARRPDVADAISKTLCAFCTAERARGLADLTGPDPTRRAEAGALVEAFGRSIAPALVTVLNDPGEQSRFRAMVALMCEHARAIAPGLISEVGRCSAAAAAGVARVLGTAGPGYEAALAELLRHPDERTGREAFRALAHVGTAEAAAVVAARVREGGGWARGAAEEALWHFPPAQTTALLRDLLGRREFVVQCPEIALRLIDRASQAGTVGLQLELGELVPLRFRFWNPVLVRVALKARELSGQ